MTEWWSYGLGDFLMFSPRTWYRLLELHNRAWWPAQPIAMVLGIGLLWAINRRLRAALRLGLVLVGLCLLFVAWQFHWVRFAPINLAAPVFALAFAAQGMLLVGFALMRRDLVLLHANAAVRTGAALLAVAVLLYPVAPLMGSRPMEQGEWFALAPDPTMLATLGLLLCLCRSEGLRHARLTWALMSAMPLLWCAVTGASLWALAAPQWWLMPLAGLLSLGVGWWQGGIARRPRARAR